MDRSTVQRELAVAILDWRDKHGNAVPTEDVLKGIARDVSEQLKEARERVASVRIYADIAERYMTVGIDE